MKNLKKALILAMTAAMLALPLAACSGGDSGSSQPESTAPEAEGAASETAETPDADAPDEAAAADFSSELITAGKIVVGTSADYPPYESLGANGEIEGFDIDMIHEVAAYMSEAGVPVEVELKNMSFDTIVTALQMGQVDIGVSAFTYDPDRDVQFSTPYLVSEQVVTVAKESGYTTIADLAGKKISAGLGTTGESAAKEMIENAEVSGNTDYTIAFESLKNGAIDAVVSDGIVARNFAAANDSLMVFDEPLIDEENSIIIKNGNEALSAAINAAVEKFIASDKYLELQQKWGIVGE